MAGDIHWVVAYGFARNAPRTPLYEVRCTTGGRGDQLTHNMRLVTCQECRVEIQRVKASSAG